MTLIVLTLALLAEVNASKPPAPLDVQESVHPKWLGFEPVFRAGECPFGRNPNPGIIACGTVAVPEDRTDPESRLIRLAVMRVKGLPNATTAVVRLDGGPGGWGITEARAEFYAGSSGETFREVAELVFFDQRGVGHSEPELCRAVPFEFLYGVKQSPDGWQLRFANMRECLREAREAGVAVDRYSTWHNALDVRDLRRALGYERWNLFGISYGTLLGQAVMQVDPEGIRAAILDSVVPAAPPEEEIDGTVESFAAALQAASRACGEHPECARAVPDLYAAYLDVFEEFDEAPLRIENAPATMFEDGRIVLDGQLAARFLFYVLYQRAALADLVLLLRVYQERNGDALLAYVEQLPYDRNPSYGHGLYYVARCRSHIVRVTPERAASVRQRFPRLGRWLDPEAEANECKNVLPAATLDPATSALETDIPTLVVAGAADPVTPPSHAAAIMDGLSQGELVVFAHTGHSALLSAPPECGRAVWRDFIRNPEGPHDLGCASAVPPPDFAVSYRPSRAFYPFVKSAMAGAWPFGLLGVALVLVVVTLTVFLTWVVQTLRRRPPLGAWSSGVASAAALIALFWAGWLALDWAMNHPMGVPLGVPEGVALPGWLAVVAVLVSVVGIARARTQGPAALAVSVLACVGSTLLLAYLTTLGLGPIAV